MQNESRVERIFLALESQYEYDVEANIVDAIIDIQHLCESIDFDYTDAVLAANVEYVKQAEK